MKRARLFLLATLVATAVATGEASADHVEGAAVHPGVQLISESGQCTANFVFSDGSSQYLGVAAHCFGTGPATETNGCTAATRDLGAPVEDAAGAVVGTLAYSSWVAMQEAGETDADTCAHNDFALVRLAPGVDVDPSVPHWGGPVGLNTDGTQAFEQIYAYGNSSLRQGITVFSPKTGLSYGTNAGGWNHPVVTAPAVDVPGDSGSGLLDADGNALGVLSHLSASVGIPTGTGVSNNYTDLNLALQYARQSVPGVQLVLGGDFDGGQLPLGL